MFQCAGPQRLPLVPGWTAWPRLLAGGYKASGVILLHLIPFFVAFWAGALQPASEILRHRTAIGLFACALLLPPLIPVFIGACALLPWVHITLMQVAGLAALFATSVSLLPAAFMCVSLDGTFAAALRPGRSLRLIVRDRRVSL
jgi:hypothetical protein